jgi:hypothetical protein
MDPDLALLVERWPDLPDLTRRMIMAALHATE